MNSACRLGFMLYLLHALTKMLQPKSTLTSAQLRSSVLQCCSSSPLLLLLSEVQEGVDDLALKRKKQN